MNIGIIGVGIVGGAVKQVFAVYMIIHQFESFLFTPLLINKVVGLSPLVVILSLLIGYELAGFW
jgi:predicted PurR-regulated permease PerM